MLILITQIIGNKLQTSKCLFRVLLSLAQMQNLGPIYKTKNVYSLMFMLVIIHRAYVLKLFTIFLHKLEALFYLQ